MQNESGHAAVSLFFGDEGNACVMVRSTWCRCRSSETTVEKKIMLWKGFGHSGLKSYSKKLIIIAVALLCDHLGAPLAIQEIIKVNHYENCICAWCQRSKILYFLQQFQNNLVFSWIWWRVCVFPLIAHWLYLMPSKWGEDVGKRQIEEVILCELKIRKMTVYQTSCGFFFT